MIRYLAFFFLTLSFLTVVPDSVAQGFDPNQFKPKVREAYEQAIDALQNGRWTEGKLGLQALVKANPGYVDGWLSLMGAFGEKKVYDSAVLMYQKAYSLDSLYCREYLLGHSINLAGMGRFTEAKEVVGRFIAIPRLNERSLKAAEYRLRNYNFALDFAATHPNRAATLDLINLGPEVNSRFSEYYPSFTIDDSILVFTRRMGSSREDFYQSLQTENGYAKATPVAGALNEPPFKGAIQISADAELLVFAGDFPDQGMGNFDLYLCQATPEGWSVAYNLGAAVNSEQWDSGPTLSPDKQAIFFSSKRTGGFGGSDIYVSYRLPDGRWGKAKNLGPTINTAADEQAPYFHVDNRTLFFTSAGHPGYGYNDLYFSRRQADSSWSKPENMGYPINTIDDEGSLVISPNGKTAYFAGARTDSYGGLDLYRFVLPEDVRPKKTGWVTGKVYDEANGKGLPSAIELRELTTGELLQKIITDESGKYLVTLPEGSSYSFTINRKGYLYYSEYFDLKAGLSDSVFTNDIPLRSIAVNATMELSHCYFETNSFRLLPEAYPELQKLANLLRENTGLRVEIGGHTDNAGNAAANLTLSANRAKAVVTYLTQQGIAANRLSYKGYGSTKPVADNSTEAGRASNRRTELKVLSID